VHRSDRYVRQTFVKIHFDSCNEFFFDRNVLLTRPKTKRSMLRGALYIVPVLGGMIAGSHLVAQQLSVADSSAVLTQALPMESASSSSSADASDKAAGELPDAPLFAQDGTSAQTPQTSPAAANASQPTQQTRRILGIIPNFRAISTDQKLPPQSVKDKFITATQDSFDYSSIFVPAILAWYSLETNATPEFGQGAVGYGRYFWHSAVDQTSENYMVEFVVPSITHEDTRYYTLGRGGFLKRTGYALSRAVVTRSDSGREVFNASEIIGAGASAGLSSLYYPTRERSLGNTGSEWGLDVGIDAASFVAKEFWPDVNHWLFHGAKPVAATGH
jgi:hypothetical protein